MPIIIYNRKNETHEGENNYPIYRPSVLGNPYTDVKDKQTKALYLVKSRDEAIKKYDDYFELKYGKDLKFTQIIDEIYEKYKNGETVYLECYCHPLPCHGDVIVKKLQRRLLKEKIKEANLKKNAE
jgi:hypothetical protein